MWRPWTSPSGRFAGGRRHARRAWAELSGSTSGGREASSSARIFQPPAIHDSRRLSASVKIIVLLFPKFIITGRWCIDSGAITPPPRLGESVSYLSGGFALEDRGTEQRHCLCLRRFAASHTPTPLCEGPARRSACRAERIEADAEWIRNGEHPYGEWMERKKRIRPTPLPYGGIPFLCSLVLLAVSPPTHSIHYIRSLLGLFHSQSVLHPFRQSDGSLLRSWP
jgi:hypothetical protein